MDRIVVRAAKPQERAKDICNKIYNLRAGEFEIEGGTEDRATVIFKCDDKSANSKEYLIPIVGHFMANFLLNPALIEALTHILEEILDFLAFETLKI